MRKRYHSDNDDYMLIAEWYGGFYVGFSVATITTGLCFAILLWFLS